MQKKIGIVIVNWNSKKEILVCLNSIKKAGFIDNVVVVDNGPEDELIEKLETRNPKLEIIKNINNLGFAEGNNRGIRYLLDKGIEYIFILNPDTEIEKETIPNLLKVFGKDKSIGIAGPKIYSGYSTPGESWLTLPLQPATPGVPLSHLNSSIPGVPKPLIWSCGGEIDKKRYSGGLIGLGEKDDGQYDKIREVDFISGTAMMVRGEVFERTGLFEKSYFMYYEDVEFCQKAKRVGFKIIYTPNSVIFHKESTSVGKNSSLQQYYMARNHMLFVERNAPIFIKLRELVRLPKTIYEHWQKRERWAISGIKDYIMRKFGKQFINSLS